MADEWCECEGKMRIVIVWRVSGLLRVSAPMGDETLFITKNCVYLPVNSAVTAQPRTNNNKTIL